MWKTYTYLRIIIWFVLELLLILVNVAAYYYWWHGHSFVPLAISGILTLVVFGIVSVAIYETFKHKHDKDPG